MPPLPGWLNSAEPDRNPGQNVAAATAEGPMLRRIHVSCVT
ncbi:hypothetical protein FAIPA1_40077 [Frankia sp. AiPs1]